MSNWGTTRGGKVSEEKNEQSGYVERAVEMRQRLNQVSPSFCLAKWAQVSIHLTTGLTQSCYHPPTHKIPLEGLKENPSQLHNTPQKIEERREMKSGTRPKGCEYCWRIEDAKGDHLSDRHYRSGEPWAAEMFDEVVAKPFDYPTVPRYVEVNFNQACNLKCSYCSPHLSTTWAKEIRKHGAYPTETPHNDMESLKKSGLMPIPPNEPNPYVDAFWEWWPTLYPTLKTFRMTGGEPLIDPNTYRVLDWIQENPNPELELAITSNFSMKPEALEKFLSIIAPIKEKGHLKSFMLFVSVDTIGEQAEYIRNGLDFNYMWSNVERYLTEVQTGMVTFISTFNNLSVVRFKDFYDKVIDLRARHNTNFGRVYLDTPILRYPIWQSIYVLPPSYLAYMYQTQFHMEEKASQLQPDLYGARDTELNRFRRLCSVMAGENPYSDEEIQLHRGNFFRFFSEHDRRRGTDFLKTFPEMEDFWSLCQDAAKQRDTNRGQ